MNNCTRIADAVLAGPMDRCGILGIDPGLTGAIAYLSPNLYETWVVDMPTFPKGKTGHELNVQGVVDLLRDTMPAVVVMERQQARPGNGAVAAHTAGRGYGVIIGACAAFGIPLELVTPQRWKKDCLDGEPKDDNNPKAASMRVARRLFPTADLGRRKDAGRAEALLIAEWARRRGMGVKP